MALLPNEIDWNTNYDKFLAWGSWLNAAFYAIPAATILTVCWYLEVADEFWVPVLIIYLIGAVAHLLNYGFMSVNIQIKTATDSLVNEIRLLMITLEEKQNTH